MKLSEVEFSVLRFATDAIIGEPSQYDRILCVAEREFPHSKPLREAIGYLRTEMKAADFSTPRTAERNLKEIAIKLLDTSNEKSGKRDETRQLAGSALMASLDLPLQPRGPLAATSRRR
jgi:hypothetical protein